MPSMPTDRPSQPSKLPPQTIERWRQIVQRAVRNNTDISQLVQQFAERAFENKTVGLDSQGAKRRALTHMRQAIARELTRATKARTGHTEPKKDTLFRPYEGVTVTFVPPQKLSKPGKKSALGAATPMSLGSDAQAYKTTPMVQKITTTVGLDGYIASLKVQASNIDQEMAQIDAVLNRGMANRDSTVAELSATTQELWRIAQEVVSLARENQPPTAALPPPPAPPAESPIPEPVIAEEIVPAEQPSPKSAGQTLLHSVQSLFKKKS